MFGLTVPVLIVFQLLHWLGFALDELLFRRYRQIDVKQPIFVTGIPRSGTTHLQRVLANHDRLSCMETWECALAPSITERYVYRFVGKLFAPIASVFSFLPLPFFKKMGAIHQLGLHEAEEDFIALLPINACFLLVVLFPHSEHYWKLSNFDSAMSSKQKKRILTFYFRIVQKHLYFHGGELRYLCKNPSFMTWVESLSEQFPDATFVLCEREAAKTVPSQLSSLKPTWELFYGEAMSEMFSDQIVSMLAGYYHYLNQLDFNRLHALRLPMSTLVSDLPGAISDVLTLADLPMTESFQKSLDQDNQKAGAYKSQHAYQTRDSYDWQRLANRFPRDVVVTATK